MSLMLNILMLVALTVKIFLPGGVDHPRPAVDPERDIRAFKFMDPQQRPLPEGTWGGAGIRMNVSSDSASVDLDCADGEISEKILVDRNGTFSVAGKFNRRHPGPVTPNEPPPVAARYSGAVNGSKMSLRITLESDGSVFGEYTLEQGRNGRIVRCL